MRKITVKGTDREFWTKLKSIERQFTSLKIMFISNEDPSYLISSALAKQKQLKSLSIGLTDESYDGIRSHAQLSY